MTSTLIHQIWKLIEGTQTGFLLTLDDQSLIQWLTQQLGERQSLTQEEAIAAKAYIQARLLLIRDLI